MVDYLDVLMPFGKYKGKPVRELTTGYCKTLHAKVALYGDLEKAIKTRLGIPVPVELTEDEKIDQAIKMTIDRLVEALGEI